MSENMYELLYMSRQGDSYSLQALFSALENDLVVFVRTVISQYSLLEVYHEDLDQEARIALYQAVSGYREDRNCTFRTYANMVVKRRIWSVMRSYSRKTAVQFHKTCSLEENIGTLEKDRIEYITKIRNMEDPEYKIYYILALEKLNAYIGRLNKDERMILETWMNDGDRKECAKKLGCTDKSFSSRLSGLKHRIKEEIGIYNPKK